MKAEVSLERALVTDGMAWALFGVAKGEGELYAKDAEDGGVRRPTRSQRQAALTLLLLFDKLLVHDLSKSPGVFRIPKLESEGLVEMVPQQGPSQEPKPLRSRKKPTRADRRGAPPAALRRSLRLIEMYRPLIVDRLLKTPSSFDRLVARSAKISQREYYEDFLDFATAYVLGDKDRAEGTVFAQAMPGDLLKEICHDLFDFQAHGDYITPTNGTLIGAITFALELATVIELSAARKVGIATNHYVRLPQVLERIPAGFSTDASAVPKSFGVIRAVLYEEGRFFPEIQGVDHVLKLRKNPHLRAFKEQFREFHAQLLTGNIDGISRARAEVKAAQRALARAERWDRALRWLTYISLPAGIAEALLGGPPIAGTSLAVLSAAGTAETARIQRKSQWLLFGSEGR